MPLSSAPFLLLHAPDWRGRLQALGCYVLLLTLFRWEALRHFSTALLGGFDGDAGLLSWLLEVGWNGLRSFDTPAFYPYGQTLAWSDNFILPSLIFHLLQGLNASTIEATNILMLGAALLNGYAAWSLCFALSGSQFGALFGGASFMLAPYLTAQLGHPQLQFAFFLPTGVHMLFRFIAHSTFLSALGFGLTVALAFLTTVYYTIFLGLGALFLVLPLFALRPERLSRRTIGVFVLGSLLGALPISPLIPPYLSIKDAFGSRGLYEAYYFAANGLSAVAASPLHALFGFTSSLAQSEAQLFPGLVLLVALTFALLRVSESHHLRTRALLCLGLFVATLITSIGVFHGPLYRYATAVLLWSTILSGAFFLHTLKRSERKLGFSILTNRSLLALLLSGLSLCSLFALGPLGNPEKGHTPLGLHALLYLFVPGLDALRAITRIHVLWLTFAAPVLSMVIAHRLQLHTRSLVLGTTALLLLGDVAFRAYPLQTPPALPAAFHFLRTQTDERTSAGILLPYAPSVKEDGSIKSWTEFARIQVRAMRWFLAAGRPTVNGYSGQQSKLMRELPRELRNFPDERSLNALSRIVGLRYLVYASNENPNFDPARFGREITQFADRLRWIMTDDSGHFLFELTPRTNCAPECEFILPPTMTSVRLSLQAAGKLSEATCSLTEPAASREIFTKPLLELSESLTVSLPETSDRARPRRLKFLSNPATHLYATMTAAANPPVREGR